MANIAFDIDDTLYKVEYEERNGVMIPVRQVPDYEVINLLLSFHKIGGNIIYLWSGGGIDYVSNFAEKFDLSFCIYIEKSVESARLRDIDITFDDEEITLGKVNIRIPRERYE